MPNMPNDFGVTEFPKIKDLPIADAILDFVNGDSLWNPLTTVNPDQHAKDPYEEFVLLCKQNLGFAARALIGRGDFELAPFQVAILETLWHAQFPLLMMTRGGGKTFLLSLYILMKAALDQSSSWGHKIVLTSASFRQSKLLMNGIEALLLRSPILLKACGTYSDKGCVKRDMEKWSIKIGNSTITALPLGDGEKIRGERATIVVADEFGSVDEEVFNVVVNGFAAVALDPIAKMRTEWARKKLLKAGVDPEGLIDQAMGNQVIRAGTATHQFNHLYRTYCNFKNILDGKFCGSGSDPDIKKHFGDMVSADSKIDYKNYAIIKIPYTEIPDGYMDRGVIDAARVTMTRDEFEREYMCEFTKDSTGFFKASAIEAATPKISEPGHFIPQLKAEAGGFYVMGLDPARMKDDFGLCIIRVEPKVHKVVFMKRWSQKNYADIVREVRTLCKEFDIQRIGIDIQGGGGSAVVDFLSAPELVPQGQKPFWTLDDEDLSKDGLFIIDPIAYGGTWVISANYDMCADIEHKRLIFPSFVDPAPYGGLNSTAFEKAQDAFECIEECWKQLKSIEVTATAKGEREHFDVAPEAKWKAKKDLYSALLIASYVARSMKSEQAKEYTVPESSIGGFIEEYLGPMAEEEEVDRWTKQ